jgi:hypothetical protein
VSTGVLGPLSVAAVIMAGMTCSDPVVAVFRPEQWNHLLEAGALPALQDWLRVNGLEPRDVDIAPITIEQHNGQRVIRYTAALRDADGHRYRDPVTGGAAREERVVPLIVEPPQDFEQREAQPSRASCGLHAGHDSTPSCSSIATASSRPIVGSPGDQQPA